MPVEVRVWYRPETDEVCIQLIDKTTGHSINAWMKTEYFRSMVATILPKDVAHESITVH